MQIIEHVDKPLPLSNDGRLALFFIGTGSAFAAAHFQTNLLLIKGDTHVLVDCGMTGPMALRATAGLEPTDIEVFLPTHSHADHVGGAECLALMNRYVGQRFLNKPKLKIIITVPYQRILWEQTLRGGLAYNEVDTDGRNLGFEDLFEVLRPVSMAGMARETFEITLPCGPGGDLRLEMFRTMHIAEQQSTWTTCTPSFGLCIDDRVFFSGDTRFDPELLEAYADRAEVFFHDVQFFPGAVHAPLADLRTLPASLRERMYLVHYADNWQEQDIRGFAGWTQQGVLYRF